MGVINLEAGISRQALYDDIYMSLANSDGYGDLFASGETALLFFSLEPDELG